MDKSNFSRRRDANKIFGRKICVFVVPKIECFFRNCFETNNHRFKLIQFKNKKIQPIKRRIKQQFIKQTKFEHKQHYFNKKNESNDLYRKSNMSKNTKK